MDVTPEHLNTLAAKLDGLDLSNEERAILDAILVRAAASGDPEVSGYYTNQHAGLGSQFKVDPGANRLVAALGGKAP